jgi:iron complex outermembrane recepter protein
MECRASGSVGARGWFHQPRTWQLLGTVALGGLIAPQAVSAQTVLPDINVIAPTPLSGHRTAKPSTAPAAPAPQTGAPSEPAPVAANTDPTAIDRDKVPSNTVVLTPNDFNHQYSPSFLDALNRGLPGVSLSDQTGNPFQKDLNYRGFTASPVQGTPQGIAVYQNGVRVNESWGDVVNWDFIPEKAIDKVSLFPSNPVFGLNAIGGALSIQMKNSFTYQGTELEALIGSYGRIQSSVQAGKQDGNLSAYALFESAWDKGWRDFANSSHINRMYVDVGARNEQTELHISFTGADNILGNVAATPVDMLNKSWSSVFTWPQDTHLQLAFLQANLTHNFSDTLAFQGNVYYRGFWQSHNDGNGTNATSCDDGINLCLNDTADPLANGVIRGVATSNPFGNAILGEIDRNWVSTNSFGGTAQLTSTNKVFEHDNHFVVGASVDHGYTQFTASSELGVIDPNTLFVQGMGIFINNPDEGQSLASLHARNTYTGFYATDTFDVTNRLSVTAGGRFNLAQINLEDQTGENSLLNSSNQFQRFNPMAGATYKITPNITAYADYAEANRAPTPLELGCSDPQHPCMIDTFLIADPPLKQVVSHTWEAGLRGSFGKDVKTTGLLTWGLGVYRTLSDDDIIEVGSPVVGGQVANFGFFQNFGKTQRQGVEAKIDYRQERWNVYANYTFVDATYQSSGSLFSPNNPNAICQDGGTLAQEGDNCVTPTVNVKPGDHIGGIPEHRFKLGADYAVTDRWKVGADLNVVGSQYLIHDDSNQFAKVPAYAVLNLHTSYQLTPNVELFGLINNALNQHYYLAGTFTSTGGFSSADGSNTGTLNDPRSMVPGMPFAAYAGVRAKF